MSHSEQFATILKSNFTRFPSHDKLKTLATRAIDLTDSKNMTAKRVGDFQLSSCGFKLLYGTELVNEEVLESLSSLAKEANAVEKITRMQNGEVLNAINGHESENRAVLHTAMRDFFENPNTTPAAQEATTLAKKEFNKLKEFTAEIDQKGTFTDLIMIGIGGSDLGPKALYLALEKFQKENRRVHFISNVDPDDATRTLQSINLSKTLVVVVSKSGSTIETLTNELFVKEQFTAQGLDPQQHFVAVTGEGSPLDNPKQYLKSFYIWDYVGGRYSATSMVGGVMLAFALGFDVYTEVLKGANAMDKESLNPDPLNNLPLLSALLGIWNRNFLNCPTVAVIPYSQALWRFPAHLQQCDMESNGKLITKEGEKVDFETGPVIFGESGTNSQHSFFQLIHQGSTPVPVEFIGFKNSQYKKDITVQGTTSQEKLLSNLFAQSLALATGQQNGNPNKEFPGNRPNRILIGNQLTPFSLGALLSYYENKVAFQGFIWGINSFDQEGVQLGKVLANKISDLFVQKREGSTKKTGESFILGEAYLKVLDQI